ncbi:MAG: peptide chain release factor 1 [Candidatus Dojkabacteria bacterium]|jgi:peptide chain release factor 1|nr:peptide chain release factor 1 [Candidatus Dojkabacteria bacterium]MDD2270312.1 peptide chain release factor 1 [Candidatus Dojkabacteria bacterium]
MNIEDYQNKYKESKALEIQGSLEQRMANAHDTGEDMSSLSEELNYYSTLASKIIEIKKAVASFKEAQELLNDIEMKELAEAEMTKNEKVIEELDEEIIAMEIDRQFSDEDDMRSAVLEIRAGAGGDEAALFAADLFRMYKNFATIKNWEISMIDYNVTQEGGYKEVIAQINGKGVYKALKYESGVHRVQRVPTTESSGRIHTSTASVAILPEARNIDIDIKPEDLNIEVMRASGAGGQCVNRTDSAVRITHIPTGIVVSCQETKYQAQNKEKAMQLLRSRLYEKKKSEEAKKRSDLRSSQIGSAMRAEKIRTYNFPQNRVTDHRIKKSWHNLEDILNGNIEELLEETRHQIQVIALKE